MFPAEHQAANPTHRGSHRASIRGVRPSAISRIDPGFEFLDKKCRVVLEGRIRARLRRAMSPAILRITRWTVIDRDHDDLLHLALARKLISCLVQLPIAPTKSHIRSGGAVNVLPVVQVKHWISFPRFLAVRRRQVNSHHACRPQKARRKFLLYQTLFALGALNYCPNYCQNNFASPHASNLLLRPTVASNYP